MAQSIWNATLDVDNSVKQNPFDWNHTNNLTTQIGRITPVFCDLVPAKTSFRVNPYFALQMMPMVFPIQTRMRASISWFRYPLRALWKDYKDYVGNFREGLEEPYLNINTEDKLRRMCSTGSLGDYLDLPTTNIGKFGSQSTLGMVFLKGEYPQMLFTCIIPNTVKYSQLPAFVKNKKMDTVVSLYDTTPVTSAVRPWRCLYTSPLQYPSAISSGSNTSATFSINAGLIDPASMYLAVVSPSGVITNVYSGAVKSGSNYVFSFSQGTGVAANSRYLVFFQVATDAGVGRSWFDDTESHITESVLGFTYSSSEVQSSELTLTTSPWYSSLSVNKDKQVKLSAYAFRAYEGIYNSMYRDNRNNPYYIDGVVQYNQWIPTMDGGADNNIYELRYANWEKDFLTTAVQSPQQGNSPLVGITTYETGKMLDNGVAESKVALVDESGKRYSIEFQSDDDGLKSVNYVELENGTVVRSARNLMDLATSGISIPDLRMVNCYQKFLELNMRKGYSYKDIVEGRFDVKVRYADLLLPEFFGGFSRDMNMNAITQTVDQDSVGAGSYKDALGSQAGVAYFNGNTNHSIECFCDEESIIMGLLVITPLPVYTQLLPKHFTYRSLLDHFNPEFNNIGFQPITYKEVCPIQAYNNNPDDLTKTFGYQRPWYEYCQRYDKAHGLFRTDLSNFLMHRLFDQRPELAQSFLIIDPEQVTDVFSVTETTDKIYGQIGLDITCKLPVARVAIPRLD